MHYGAHCIQEMQFFFININRLTSYHHTYVFTYIILLFIVIKLIGIKIHKLRILYGSSWQFSNKKERTSETFVKRIMCISFAVVKYIIESPYALR